MLDELFHVIFRISERILHAHIHVSPEILNWIEVGRVRREVETRHCLRVEEVLDQPRHVSTRIIVPKKPSNWCVWTCVDILLLFVVFDPPPHCWQSGAHLVRDVGVRLAVFVKRDDGSALQEW